MNRRPANSGIRTPRRESSVNDDLAEKSMRRRQSHSGAGNHSGMDHQTPSRETLADIARRVTDTPIGDRSFSGSRRVSGRGGSSGQMAEPADFDEWMRLIRQNRVKGPNAFTIHLIDYFHHMVRHDQDGANEANDVLNFQKATYTLGGCVKVYKTRIASVASDTSKLLNGIVDGSPITEVAGDEAGVESGEEGYEEDADEDDANPRRRARNKRKKKTKPNATVVEPKKLSIDINELSTTIDPLFRKMCADFDKRGAGGMLQYSLKQDSQGRLLLDAETEVDTVAARAEEAEDELDAEEAASTRKAQLSTIAEEDEEEEEAEDRNDEVLSDCRSSAPTEGTEESKELERRDFVGKDVDLPHINLTYISNLALDDLRLCRSIDFVMEAIENPEDGAESLLKDIEKWAFSSAEVAGSSTPLDAQASPDDASPPISVPDLGDDFEDEDRAESGAEDAMGGGEFGGGDFGGEDFGDDFDEQQNEHALDASLLSIAAPPSGNWMDSELLRNVDRQVGNWAGPEHWKVQRLRARRATEEPSSDANGGETAAASSRPQRAIRAAHTVDFLHPTVEENVLLSVGKTISLTAAQIDLDQEYLLPDDLGVTIKQIVSLETRPKTGPAPAFVSQRRQVHTVRADSSNLDDLPDADAREVWNQFDDGDGGDMGYDGGADDFGGGYDADFFTGTGGEHGIPEMHDPADAAMSPMARLHALAGGRGDQLSYARTAKRVDVRLLKENIWREIEKPEESAHTLNEVMTATMPRYSGAQQANLSPSMFFISLLHLANEHGLRLENVSDYSDIHIVGETAPVAT